MELICIPKTIKSNDLEHSDCKFFKIEVGEDRIGTSHQLNMDVQKSIIHTSVNILVTMEEMIFIDHLIHTNRNEANNKRHRKLALSEFPNTEHKC